MIFCLLTPFSIVNGSDQGTTAAPFLKLGVGARSLAMGGAVSAAGEGAEALYWNPAGINRAERPQLMLTYNPLIEDLQYNQGAFSFRIKRTGVALGFSGLSHPTIDAYDSVGNKLSAGFKASDQLGALGFALPVGSQASFGLTGKYVRSSIDGVSATAWAGDAGLRTVSPLSSSLTHALWVRNLGGKLSFINQDDPLPVVYGIGQALTLKDRFVIAVDVGSQKGTGVVVSGGAEWRVLPHPDKTFSLRAGYNTQRNEADKLSGAAFGLGLVFLKLSLDYAWVPYGNLGDTHAVTLIWRIPKFSARTSSSPIRKPSSRNQPAGALEEVPANADTSNWVTITLDSGDLIDGEIVKKTDDQIRVQTANRVIIIKNANIKKMERYNPRRKRKLGNLK